MSDSTDKVGKSRWYPFNLIARVITYVAIAIGLLVSVHIAFLQVMPFSYFVDVQRFDVERNPRTGGNDLVFQREVGDTQAVLRILEVHDANNDGWQRCPYARTIVMEPARNGEVFRTPLNDVLDDKCRDALKKYDGDYRIFAMFVVNVDYNIVKSELFSTNNFRIN